MRINRKRSATNTQRSQHRPIARFINPSIYHPRNLAVVDIDGVIPGVLPGTVLNTYIETEFLKIDDEHFINGNSAVLIPAGVYLRTTYHSTGTGQDVPFIIRYELRK